MDDSDWATLREEQHREAAISNTLLRGAGNPMLAKAHCVTCGYANDRQRDGFDVCSDCVADPGWHLRGEAS